MRETLRTYTPQPWAKTVAVAKWNSDSFTVVDRAFMIRYVVPELEELAEDLRRRGIVPRNVYFAPLFRDEYRTSRTPVFAPIEIDGGGPLDARTWAADTA